MKKEPKKLFEMVLVRHGQSLGNAGINESGTLRGSADSPLSENGRLQAQLLGKRFSSYPFDCIISSGLVRAVETACLVASAQPENGAKTVHIDPLLTECGTEEEYEGYSFCELSDMFKAVKPFIGVSEDDCMVIPSKTDDAEFNRSRAKAFMKKLYSEFRNVERIMVTAHGVFNTELLLELLGLDADRQLLDPDFRNTSVTHFTFYEEGTGPYGFDISLTCLNNIDHLRDAFPQMFFENKI